MSNNKQSSVEWLVKELNQKIDFIPMNRWDEIKEVIEKAKAMHKEEIVNAVDGFPIHTRHMDGEEYYKEIFEGNNEQQ